MSEESVKIRTRIGIIEDRLLDVLSKSEDQANFLNAFNAKLTGHQGEETLGKEGMDDPAGGLDKIDLLLTRIQEAHGRIDYEIERLREIA